MARIIVCANQKGGTGKTTTCVNLAAYLAKLGKYTLLVDLDPQGNATSGVGLSPSQVKKGIYDALIGRNKISEVTYRTKIRGYGIVPATEDLAGANIEFVDLPDREYRLAKTLAEVSGKYEYILIDCPPSLGLLTINGLVAANEVLIPVQCEFYALEGLSQLLGTVKLVQKNLKPELKILGAVLTLYDKRTLIGREVLKEMRRHFPGHVFESVIPRNVRLSEAPSYGQTILEYDHGSRGGRAYFNLAEEIIKVDSSLRSE